MRGTLISRLRSGATKLLRDQGGNALMLTAAAIVPIIGIVGSAVDIGRGYMAQLRLQQACDAGVLAGRRAMAAGSYTEAAREKADAMFAFNYPTDLYGSSGVSFSSDVADGSATDVLGTANATLPTAIMFVFGHDQFNLSVSCAAKLEISNTDVILVLDVTKSMDDQIDDADAPPPTSSSSGGKGKGGSTPTPAKIAKIAALRNASKLFLTTLTSATTDGRLRVGVVPYSGAVNVGRILKPEWIADTATLPSRSYNKSTSKYTLQNRTFNVAPGKIFGANGALPPALTFNTGANGANVTATWKGCVTEVRTTPFGPSATAPAGALDMIIDRIPKASDEDDAKWQLYLPEFTYDRTSTTSQTTSTNGKSFYENTGWSACPDPVLPLTEMDSAGQTKFNDMIDALTPVGGTYHDSGIVWGARMISPTGLFEDDNKSPNSRPVSRHIIFMTDGEMDARVNYYSHQGVEQAIVRTGATGKNATATELDNEARHSNRMLQLCNQIKDKKVVIWVIGFGVDLDNAANEKLVQCASTNKAFEAGSSTQLAGIFQNIANAISRLRLSQ